MRDGYIKLHRRILDWGWYTDTNTFRVFIHLLLRANWQDKEWRGQVIKRGQIVIGMESFGAEVGLTRTQIRRAFNLLQDTQEISLSTTNKNTLVTIENYEKYQDVGIGDDHQTTIKRPSNDHQTTTTKESKNLRIYNPPSVPPLENENQEKSPKRKAARTKLAVDFIPPESWLDFALARGYGQTDAKAMWQKFEAHHRAKGSYMADWDAAWRTWVLRQQDFDERQKNVR